MIKKLYFLLSLLLLGSISSYGQLQSPNEFLPHQLGEQFTPHYMLVDYMYHIADNSPNVRLVQYGMTNEKRPCYFYTSLPQRTWLS
jgi:hypothetical protein